MRSPVSTAGVRRTPCRGGDTNLCGYALADPVNLWDPEGTAFSISAFAAGALNSFTLGVSNRVAGKLLGFDPSCADWGDGYGSGGVIGDLNPRGILSRGIRSGVRQFAKKKNPRAGDLPARGKPNSTDVRDDGRGNGQIRDYGEDGRAKTDYDFGHDHRGDGDPHAHDWDWSRDPPRQEPRPIGDDE